jgi:hypothetical protein
VSACFCVVLSCVSVEALRWIYIYIYFQLQSYSRADLKFYRLFNSSIGCFGSNPITSHVPSVPTWRNFTAVIASAI